MMAGADYLPYELTGRLTVRNERHIQGTHTRGIYSPTIPGLTWAPRRRSAPERRSRQPRGLCTDTLQVDSCLDTPLACSIVRFLTEPLASAARPAL